MKEAPSYSEVFASESISLKLFALFMNQNDNNRGREGFASSFASHYLNSVPPLSLYHLIHGSLVLPQPRNRSEALDCYLPPISSILHHAISFPVCQVIYLSYAILISQVPINFTRFIWILAIVESSFADNGICAFSPIFTDLFCRLYLDVYFHTN